jgi:hypothetical protein
MISLKSFDLCVARIGEGKGRSSHSISSCAGHLAPMQPSNLKNSRILTYGSNAMVTAVLGKTSSDRILQHAHTLVAQLVADREVTLVGKMEPAFSH